VNKLNVVYQSGLFFSDIAFSNLVCIW